MATEYREFVPTPFTAGRIDAGRIVGDEEKLFRSHCQLAAKGHASQFPLRLQAQFSAALSVDQKGASKVLTMEIDTVGMLPIIPRDALSRMVVIKTVNGPYGANNETVVFSRMSDGSAWRSSLEYADEMPADHESFRVDVLSWAQDQFEAGVADMAKSQMFDRRAFDRLKAEIRQGIDRIFDNVVYTPGHGRGDFVEKSAPPRLICSHYEDSGREMALKLQRHGENPADTWTGILASMPAEAALTASKVRFAVSNGVYGYGRHEIDYRPLEGWEDTLHKNGILARRDQVDFEGIRGAETALFERAVRSMAKDLVRFHEDGLAVFSDDTVTACRRFASVTDAPRIGQDGWEDAVSALQTASAEDHAPMAAFQQQVGWTLLASPFLFIRAKTNLFLGNDLAHGLYEDGPTVKTSVSKGPKR